jgi:hypothetical protein
MTHINAALDNLMKCIETGLKGAVEETQAENEESGVGIPTSMWASLQLRVLLN